MSHGIYLIRESAQAKAFSGLILPDVLPRLEEPSVYLLGAVDRNCPVGAAVLAMEGGCAQVLSIAVPPDWQRKGIGSALLRHCIRLLRRTSIQMLYAVLTPKETDAAALFAAFGMKPSEAGAYYRFTLADAAAQGSLRGSTAQTVSLSEVPSGLLRSYLRSSFPGDPTAATVRFDPQLSQVCLEEMRPSGCLLVTADDELSIDWLASQSGDKLTPLYLLRGALAAAAAVYPPDMVVTFAAYTPTVCRLANTLLPHTAAVPIQSWELNDGPFRLTDTAPAGWEKE